MKRIIFLLTPFFLILAFTSCKQPQEARKPISHSSGAFMKESIDRNKKLIAAEEGQIQSIIKKDPSKKYIASQKGYWYYYETRNMADNISPKKGDIALFDYEVKDLKGNIIYSQAELGPQVYKVDQQEIMMGLRDGIKLMRKKEKVHFLFTSFMGYGYHGDNNKIGINEPLMCTVTLRDFMTEAQYKAQIQAAAAAPKPVTKTKDTLTN